MDQITIKRKDEIVGTFSVIDKELHFLDCFSKEWECFDKDYLDILTEKELKKLKNSLGKFKI